MEKKEASMKKVASIRMEMMVLEVQRKVQMALMKGLG